MPTSAFNRFGGAIGGPWPVEVREYVGCPAFECSTHLFQFLEGRRDPGAEGVNEGLHELLSLGLVFLPVGGDHALIRTPRRFDLYMLLLSKQISDSLLLLLGQQPVTGMQRQPGLVERIPGPSPVPTRALLHPATAVIESVASKTDYVERVHDSNSGGQFLGGSTFEPGEPIHSRDFHPVPPRLGPLFQPGSEDLLGAALDHIQQP